MSKNDKEDLTEIDAWRCETCSVDVGGFPEIKAHMKEIHGVDELKGTKSMVMHMDCAKTFSSAYEVEIKGIKLTWFSRRVRSHVKRILGIK